MKPFVCVNKHCPHYYVRKIHGFTDYMCSARRGIKIRPYDLGSGRLIKLEKLKECPLEKPRKSDLVAKAVGMCHAPHRTVEEAMSCLAGLLWEIAKGTRYEQHAKIGIMGVCPEFFKDKKDE